MTPANTPVSLWSLTAQSSEEAFALYLAPIRTFREDLAPIDIAVGAVAVMLIAVAFSIAPAGKPLKAIPLMLGGISGLALIREGLATKRGLTARVCFSAAGFVLLMESFLYWLPHK